MVRERLTYDRLKSRGISVIFVHRLLSSAGFNIPKRTLQHYIDSDFLKCKDDLLKNKVELIINEYDNLKTKLT